MTGYMQRVYIFTHLEFIQGRGWPATCNVYTFLRTYYLLRGGGRECPATCNIYTFLRAHSLLRGAGVRLYATYIYIFTHI